MKMMSYIIYHCDHPVPPNSESHTVLAKGGFVPPEGTRYVTDANGDHVAELSSSWSEITAMYWVWKNAEKPDYVSFPHYRRQLWFIGRSQSGRIRVAPTADNLSALVSEANYLNALNLLKFSDCLIADPITFQISLEQQYKSLFPSMFWDHFIASQAKLGLEFKKNVSWFSHTTRLNYAHLFVMPWHLFDEYMEHLMVLLAELDPVFNGHRPVVPRAQAHAVERFFNYYLYVKRIRTHSVPVVLLGNECF